MPSINAPTPRNLDPRFKDANPPADATEVDVDPEVAHKDDVDEKTSGDDEVYDNGGFIVHRVQYTDNAGVVRERTHGPMPVAEWAKYEKENNL